MGEKAGWLSSASEGGNVAHSAPQSVTIVLPLPFPLLSDNVTRRMHWTVKGRHAKKQRLDAYLCAVNARQRDAALVQGDRLWESGRVRVDVEVRPRPRMKQHDDTAIWEALKPTLDGFEDAGIVANDKQFMVGTLTWRKWERTGEVVITLTAVG